MGNSNSSSGNLPTRLVNRVTLSQPKSLAIVREKVAALHEAEAAGGSEDLSTVKKKSAELWSTMVKYKEAKSQDSEDAPHGEEKESILEWSLVGRQDETESLLSSSYSQNHFLASNSSVSLHSSFLVFFIW